MRTRYFHTAAFGVAVMLLCVGCSESAPSLSGTITYNGAPVADGYVRFSPAASGTSFAAKITGGKYQADKVYTGQYTVLVTANTSVAGPRTREEAAAQRPGASTAAPAPAIPENAEGNGQTVEITGGAQTLDFALTGPPRQ
jgi:hypothetical protein